MRIKTLTALLLNGFAMPAPQGAVVEVEADEGAALITVGYAKETTEEANWPPSEDAAAAVVADQESINVAERNQAAGKTVTENLVPDETAKPAAATKADKK